MLQWAARPPPGGLVLLVVLATVGGSAAATASLLLLTLHQRPLLAEPNRALLAQDSENGSLHSPNRECCSPPGRTRLSDFTFAFHFHALEKEMATHSRVLAWRIPGDGGAWWAADGVAQSRTQLKRLSSSSSSNRG